MGLRNISQHEGLAIYERVTGKVVSPFKEEVQETRHIAIYEKSTRTTIFRF
jgi:hypothetical protein